MSCGLEDQKPDDLGDYPAAADREIPNAGPVNEHTGTGQAKQLDLGVILGTARYDGDDTEGGARATRV